MKKFPLNDFLSLFVIVDAFLVVIVPVCSPKEERKCPTRPLNAEHPPETFATGSMLGKRAWIVP